MLAFIRLTDLLVKIDNSDGEPREYVGCQALLFYRSYYSF